MMAKMNDFLRFSFRFIIKSTKLKTVLILSGLKKLIFCLRCNEWSLDTSYL